MAKQAHSTVKTNTDLSGDFERTAIFVSPGAGTSFDLVDEAGNLIARINAFNFRDGHADIDVIPSADTPQFDHKGRVLTFEGGVRGESPLGGGILALDFHYWRS